ncbi:hypothetical protein HaLaN_19389, partial [Haematococcus lacustris]
MTMLARVPLAVRLMASASPKQTNIGKLAPRATLSCKVRSGCFIKRPPKSLKFPGFSKKLTSEEAGACIRCLCLATPDETG